MSTTRRSALIDGYCELQQEYRQITGEIERLRARGERACQQMSDCIVMAERVFDIRLSDHVKVDPSIASRLQARTIKELVLDAVRRAYPAPIRAVDIQRKLTGAGHIYPKTVGMNLFRWSQVGRARCEGRQWFLVPPPEQNSEAPEDRTQEFDPAVMA
jgi:hypothetical protein